MATFFARGETRDNITTAEKRDALAQSLKRIGKTLRRVLILPPDHTRLNSDAGELTRLLYEMLSPTTPVDIMPTLAADSGLALSGKRSLDELYVTGAAVADGRLYAISAAYSTLVTIDLASRAVVAARAVPGLSAPVGIAVKGGEAYILQQDGAVRVVSVSPGS